ncbi:hypothetical protein WISP_79841 [Willisornis vidua]|uniref:Cadherin domain-containing protein n=1 Tax=Willisornis vidua TaxID=1566151 RepID=A0ABQ9DAY2_9PASS|nr:hypothetical protein WISP_79841 [Willisornis vidua]
MPKGSFADDVSKDLRLQLSTIQDASILDKEAITLVCCLDFEKGDFYEPEVQAHDGGGLFNTSKVRFAMTDISEHASQTFLPLILNVISEDAPLGIVMALVHVQDCDLGANSEVHCSFDGGPPFRLEKSFGDHYRTVTTRELDREQVWDYNLTERAHDGGSPSLQSSAVLALRVLDVNDNAPVFTQERYRAQLAENNVAGALVLRVRATDADWGHNAWGVAVDADAGQNAWLSYELAKAMEPGLFRVGLLSGEVRTARDVTKRDAPLQRLVLLVRDHAQLPRFATATLAIALLYGFSDTFLQLEHTPASRQQTQAAEEELPTIYLLASLGCVSSFFLLSVLTLATAKLFKARLREHFSPPSPSLNADRDFSGDNLVVGGTDTLLPACRSKV